MPAAAVYFRDPDGHQLEYLAMLDEPARPDAGIAPWSAWTSANTGRISIVPYTGARDALRPLFAEAEDFPAQLDSYLDTGTVLVARDGDAIVGHLQLVDHRVHDRCEVTNMAVEASYRRRGIGLALIDRAIELARSSGRSTLTVATATADVGNLRFYQRAGFRLRAVERDAFGTTAGYAGGTVIEGIELRDRVWLDLDLGPSEAERG